MSNFLDYTCFKLMNLNLPEQVPLQIDAKIQIQLEKFFNIDKYKNTI